MTRSVEYKVQQCFSRCKYSIWTCYISYFLVLDNTSVSVDKLFSTTDDAEIEIVVQIDLEYTEIISLKYRKLLFSRENKKDTKENKCGFRLSRQILKNNRPPKKLLRDHTMIENSFFTFRDLKILLQQGMQVTRVHRVTRLEQNWGFERYIDGNVKWTAMKNDFIRTFMTAAIIQFLERQKKAYANDGKKIF